MSEPEVSAGEEAADGDADAFFQHDDDPFNDPFFQVGALRMPRHGHMKYLSRNDCLPCWLMLMSACHTLNKGRLTAAGRCRGAAGRQARGRSCQA